MGKLKKNKISESTENIDSLENTEFNSNSMTKAAKKKKRKSKEIDEAPRTLIKSNNDDQNAAAEIIDKEKAAAFLAKYGRPWVPELTASQRRALARQKGRLLRRERGGEIKKKKAESGKGKDIKNKKVHIDEKKVETVESVESDQASDQAGDSSDMFKLLSATTPGAEAPWSKSQKKKFRIMRAKLKAQLDVETKNKQRVNKLEAARLKKAENLTVDNLKSRLAASRFRYINEQLYTTNSDTATQLFEGDPSSFQVYHEGYQLQIAKWPVKPIERAIAYVLRRPKSDVIVDMGCGEAILAQSVSHKVKSFDLKAINDRVTVADMANIPLESGTSDVVICCLSLMGTNLVDFINEAHRLLKPGGVLWIAEVVSRFEGDMVPFCQGVESVGFTMFKQDTSCSSHFAMLYFRKNIVTMEEKKKKQMPNYQPKRVAEITLAPCLYKKR